MKILFVCSGNQAGGITPVVKNQGESIKGAGHEVDYFTISGKGFGGYLKNIPGLVSRIKKGNYEIIHAHYALSGMAATLATSRPVIVSLMGSEAYSPVMLRILIRLLSRFRWSVTIVKTASMRDRLNLPWAEVIPNGVDTHVFREMDGSEYEKPHLMSAKYPILFLSDPSRPEKNYSLAEEAVRKIGNKDINLIPAFGIHRLEVPLWINSAAMLLLTSMHEGSPNSVKEAMACNIPVVATDVGDIRTLLEGVYGCYVAQTNIDEIAECIEKAVSFGSRTNGRDRILSLGLDSANVAKKLVDIYTTVVSNGH